MSDAWSWDQMLGEFRALGGVAENIGLRQSPLGRGLFALDPAKPVAIHTPPNLLVATDDVLFDDGVLRLGNNAAIGGGERDFFERYQAAFSWGGGGRADCAAFVAMLDALPQAARGLLTIDFMSGLSFEGPADRRIESQFLRSRAIRRRGVPVLMPVAELANHAIGGVRYCVKNGVSIRGAFAGEVLVKYRHADAFQIFKTWGFSSPEPLAFSLPAFVPFGSRILMVLRKLPQGNSQSLLPEIRIREPVVELSHLLLGNTEDPEQPRRIFTELLSQLKQPDAGHVFAEVRDINRVRLLKLAAALHGCDFAGSSVMRAMCDSQLKAVASCTP